MDKYIKFKFLEKWILTESASLDGEEDRKYVVERLRDEIPDADVRPVRYGKWEKHGWSIKCSECGYDMPFATRNFCPNCGAGMKEAPDA